jgi:Tfp pilus assembly protein PilV
MRFHTPHKQKGFSLTESLAAFVIVTGGLLTMASFQAGMFNMSGYSKARTEALALAQQKIEEFKHYTLSEEINYIDENNDGTMDADGTYTDAAITGRNAVFTRSWDVTTTADGKIIDVDVSWTDPQNVTQTVTLESTIPFLSPRAGADQMTELDPPSVVSPGGRAYLGDGYLDDYPSEDITLISSPGTDGLSKYQNNDDLLLVDGEEKVLLTLEDACASVGDCTDFAQISGTVYLDTALTNVEATDLRLLASDAAYCQSYVTSGSMTNPPVTPRRDYEYFEYTCYIGGGWHGNIGFVLVGGLQQKHKVCQGDPAQTGADGPAIQLRRAYRGMLSRTVAGETVYYSHGIADAAVLSGHDFVFTELDPNLLDGRSCLVLDTDLGPVFGPMMRDDSVVGGVRGALFAENPGDFFCLNDDDNNDTVADYLDLYDDSIYTADTSCPYDPTDPPIANYSISGRIGIETALELDLSTLTVETSDGEGNCTISETVVKGVSGYILSYSCNVYDWGSGWSGYVEVQPNVDGIQCPNSPATRRASTA